MVKKSIIEIVYLFSTFLLIGGLKIVSIPEKARKGNWILGFAIALAISASIWDDRVKNLAWIFSAMIVGSVVGIVSARNTKMFSLPLMVSFLNGMGGVCASIIGFFEFFHHPALQNSVVISQVSLAVLFSTISGVVSFAGSIITFSKLQNWVTTDSFRYPLQKTLNIILLLIIISLSVFLLLREGKEINLLVVIVGLSFLYGFLLILPVQGNNIPVAISVLNSITGFATLMVGLIYENQILLVSGIIVWSAGILLAFQMSRALNRTLFSIFFQNKEEIFLFNESKKAITAKEISAIDIAILIAYAKRVVVVPGYGFGVAQAQYICQELDQLLTEKGVEVFYAVHPVAGRMPGHMNVLLADANIPYSRYLQLEEANQQFPITDIVLVIGANDIVNPKALSDKASPLYGMPILEVTEAKSVIVLKKGTNSSYSGESNPLFFHEKTSVLFGDAKQSLNKIVKEVIDN